MEGSSLDGPPGFSFWQAQLELLGARDPVEVLAATPDALRRLFGSADERAYRRRPANGVWSPVEVLGHLVDVEWVFGFRIRTTRCDVDPALQGIDQDRWVSTHRWRDHSVDDLLVRFTALRGLNVDYYRGLSTRDLARSALHADAGVVQTLDDLRRIHAGHDLSHTRQIEERLGLDAAMPT